MPEAEAAVCDASVLASITFGDRHSADALALTRSRRLFAPALLRYEMAQVALRRCAAAPETAGLVLAAFRASLRVPIRLVEPSWPAVLDVARNNNLTAYDASYLQLALALRLPLATLDERLGRAADSAGLRARLRPM